MANILSRYKNGNYTVTLLSDGTKIRENDLDNLTPAFPENMDVNISNKCDGGCEFCYLGATPFGQHADIMNAKWVDTLHSGVELAINGNDTSHPDLVPFLEKLKAKGVISNLTVNQQHFEKHIDFIKTLVDQQLIYGIGISLKTPSVEFIQRVKQFPNAVIHTIYGIHTYEDYKTLSDNDLKVLILGYKELERGISYHENHPTETLTAKIPVYVHLKEMIQENWFKVISFDNLAIEQLNLKRLISENIWNEFYMGDDAQYTFYIDMVENKFSKNSVAPANERYNILDSVDEMFAIIREI